MTKRLFSIVMKLTAAIITDLEVLHKKLVLLDSESVTSHTVFRYNNLSWQPDEQKD